MRATELKRWATADGVLVQFLTKDYAETDSAFEHVNSGKDMDVEIKPHREKRSLDANAYMWVLCDKIAGKLHTTKESIYRIFVKQVGVFDWVAIKEDAADLFCEVWKTKGIGWITEVEESKLKGCKKICCYYGSSSYDTAQMARLIDEIVYQAKAMGIEVLPPDELDELKQKWGA